MSHIVFLADETDAEDLDAVCGILVERGHDAHRAHPRDVSILGGPRGLEIFHRRAPFCPDLTVGWVFEDWLGPGIAQLVAFEAAGLRVVNDGTTLFRGQNKIAMSASLHALGVPHASTWATWDLAFAPPVEEFPVVVKPGLVISGGHTVHASGGGVARVEDVDQWASLQVVLRNLRQPIYGQTFVATGSGDIRVWVFGDRAVAAVQKVPVNGEWVTNVSVGTATQRARALSVELVDLAEAAAKAVSAPIAGVDIGEADGELSVFEVNTCPTFLPSEAILGNAVALALADFLEGAARSS